MDGWMDTQFLKNLDLKGQFVLTLQNTPLSQQEHLTPKSERKKREVLVSKTGWRVGIGLSPNRALT